VTTRIEELLRNNRSFVEQQLSLDTHCYDKLAEGQHPEFLWFGCGGIKAAMGHESHGLIDTEQHFWKELEPLGEAARLGRMVELNVIEQVYKLGKTSVIQNAWKASGKPHIHGWVFDLHTSLIEPQTGMINHDGAMAEVCKFNNGIVGH
jgi:carbonic anhydrase